MSEDKLISTLHTFFPRDGYTNEAITEGIVNGEILVNPSQFVTYLQSALHDESLLEVKLGEMPRVFFCRIIDHPPTPADNDGLPGEQESSDTIPEEESAYSKGDYLDEMEHLIITPLEPAEGNYRINNCSRVLVRAVTTKKAIEFCCYYQKKTWIGDMPVLQLSFPLIGRQVKDAREYRVKVPGDMNLNISVDCRQRDLQFTTQALDISMNGMGLNNPLRQTTSLKIDDRLSLQIFEEEALIMSLEAEVRHVTRLRNAQGLQYVFGVQFDLESQAMVTEVEQLVASIQRARLRRISAIQNQYGINLSDW
ncbi:flagellar brake protein [Desulfogranum mediterraneum]|uniref:flagellar brake protein n=1 Tax=Desulfogranum mediterraneum TaxID=160661 RepID=UPI000423D840|nr:PilZ domain-containing protein [Desulfogranum mediterraneum]